MVHQEARSLARRIKPVIFSLVTLLLTIAAAEGILNLLSARMPNVKAALARTPIRMAVVDPVLGWSEPRTCSSPSSGRA